MQECAGRRIRPMDHDVAIHARSANRVRVGVSPGKRAPTLDAADSRAIRGLTVVRAIVAFVAHEWRP